MLAGNASAAGTTATTGAGPTGVAGATDTTSTAGDTDTLEPTRWQASSPEEFVQKLWPCAQQAGKELGVDPRHLLAQAALETGWGKSLPCDTDGTTSFNFFGIKATGDWQGDSVSVKTLEFEGGTPVPRQAKFRSYDSAADSFRDYVEVLRNNPRYADALHTGGDTKAFAGALQRGGYATDPAYAQKIAAIVQNLPNSETALKSSSTAPMNPPIDLF
jgi:flagellar protein FlgJ